MDTPGERALFEVGRALQRSGYRFVTPTPETHRRVNARPGCEEGRTLRDVFGWSRPFAPGVVPEAMLGLLAEAGALEQQGARLRSLVRFSSLGDLLFVHSAYPTREADAVFFGPDTYRFAALLESAGARGARVVDVGAGSGAGGLSLGARAGALVLADINERALSHARVNAALAGVPAEVVRSDVLAGVQGPVDLIVANPPYLADEARRVYRDGGGSLGIELSVRIVRESLQRLGRGGKLVLYTASPICDGEDPLLRALEPLLRGVRFRYRELDPDVFGEELERPAYARADRIAVVALEAET